MTQAQNEQVTEQGADRASESSTELKSTQDKKKIKFLVPQELKQVKGALQFAYDIKKTR